jgi:hypothetical protein
MSGKLRRSSHVPHLTGLDVSRWGLGTSITDGGTDARLRGCAEHAGQCPPRRRRTQRPQPCTQPDTIAPWAATYGQVQTQIALSTAGFSLAAILDRQNLQLATAKVGPEPPSRPVPVVDEVRGDQRVQHVGRGLDGPGRVQSAIRCGQAASLRQFASFCAAPRRRPRPRRRPSGLRSNAQSTARSRGDSAPGRRPIHPVR